MRTRAVLGSIFASIGVLVVGWQAGAGANSAVTTATTTTTHTTAGTSTTTDPNSSGASTATTDSTATVTSTNGTYVGDASSTRWGDVQVQVTITDGSITDVTALQLTNADGRSVQISNTAAPILRDEVIASQSANVSNVSGATYTTQAYLSSVQSALDQAGF